jgi:hypothetical protein
LRSEIFSEIIDMTKEELQKKEYKLAEQQRILKRESNEYNIKCAKSELSAQEMVSGDRMLTEMKQAIDKLNKEIEENKFTKEIP